MLCDGCAEPIAGKAVNFCQGCSGTYCERCEQDHECEGKGKPRYDDDQDVD